MCVICISDKNVRQPSEKELTAMWNKNPHGAGYMYINDGKVEIHKGFMDLDDFLRNVRSKKFTNEDPVIYHFRISTQAGVNPYMTHPFPLTDKLEYHRELDLRCSCGVVHNGIIDMTSNGDPTYSDTSLFVAKYMNKLIKNNDDLRDENILDIIKSCTGWSKFAIMDKTGYIATIGDFIEDRGLLYSNDHHMYNGYCW